MADSFNKKDREKKRRKRKQDKQEKKAQRKQQEGKTTDEFMYVDEDGNLTSTPPDPTKKKKVIKAEDIEVSVPKKEKSDVPNFQRTGRVKFFNNEKGYGFIIDKSTKESFFVHVDSLIDPIMENDMVTFEVGKGPKGPIAFDVKLVP